MSFIQRRNFERTESDSFKLDVQNKLSDKMWAVEVRDPETGILLGWNLQPAYE